MEWNGMEWNGARREFVTSASRTPSKLRSKTPPSLTPVLEHVQTPASLPLHEPGSTRRGLYANLRHAFSRSKKTISFRLFSMTRVWPSRRHGSFPFTWNV